jgi:O-glycosyl hydrolase
VIPVLKEILAIRPGIKILGSPWSAPAWMKTNNDVKGGELKPEYCGAFAKYFVKYIEDMRAEGISIDAITIENEPLNPKNTPSMVMFAQQQDTFIAKDLGSAFEKAGNSDEDSALRSQPGCTLVPAIHFGRSGGEQVCRWDGLSPVWWRDECSGGGA